MLHDIIDEEGLLAALIARHVSAQDHPELDLRILNYTHSCQYDRAWTDVTRACRGLIYRPSSGEVVARPWPKFFNYGEHTEGSLDLDAPAEVTDKMDGSLGILYPTTERRPSFTGPTRPEFAWAISTRGSFTSDQAIHATALLRSRYADFVPFHELTYLFEIVHPTNRIVLDYGDADDLYFLGAVETATGVTFGPRALVNWDGPRAETLPVSTLREALALEPRENAEGVVIRTFGSDAKLIKIKQEDYVALHRIVTGLNERTVWEYLGAGGTVAELCEPLPDEFHSWVEDVAARLLAQRDEILNDARHFHEAIAPAVADRKEYAAEAVKHPDLRPWLFMLLDGKDPSAAIWRTLRPSADRPLVSVGEDVA